MTRCQAVFVQFMCLYLIFKTRSLFGESSFFVRVYCSLTECVGEHFGFDVECLVVGLRCGEIDQLFGKHLVEEQGSWGALMLYNEKVRG